MPKSRTTNNRLHSNSKRKSETAKRKTQNSPSTASYSALKERFDAQAKELRDALERESATSEILRVIASSPTDLQPVLDTVAGSAARLCDATDALIVRVDGNNHIPVASYGVLAPTHGIPTNRESPAGRAILDRQTIYIRDLAVEVETEFPAVAEFQKRFGHRTMLAMPLLREGVSIGAILIRRLEMRPFTDKQIALLKTFADQAVIAIENVRRFNEQQESLEQQTATSEILSVIASSPTDLKPVLETITERAARVCGAEDGVLRLIDGNVMRLAAHYGSFPDVAVERPINRQSPPGRAVVDQEVVHVENPALVAETEYPEIIETIRRVGFATVLAVPLLCEGVALGVIHFRRLEIRPFSDKQIALIRTFADQAVIAIENVRLFKELQDRNAELREALEHQTATSEVLGIISRSPTDVQPVLDAIVESAAKVCGIDNLGLRLREGNTSVLRAHFGPIPPGRAEISVDEQQFRWVRDHGTLHIPDVRAQNDFPTPGSVTGSRTFLFVPLRQQGELVGTLVARRIDVRPFTPAQIKLLETFAEQAVIAIENVRLFKELQERNRDLTEALEQQTATSEILRVIASSPADIQPVLDTVASNAARLCEATDAQIRLVEGDGTRLVASFGSRIAPEFLPTSSSNPAGKAILERRPIHVRDLAEAAKTEFDTGDIQRRTGTRTFLAMPMLRQDTPIGVINIRRTEIHPFSDKKIAILKTFADQAVIAIENVRLFQELEARTSELARSVGELKALGEIGQAVSTTLDLQTVLSTIVGHAVQLSGTRSE